MTTTHTRPTHTGGDIARGLGAALALAGFVVGVPVALVALAPVYLPDRTPGWGQLWDRVTSPDDGTLLLLVLAAVAWITWAAFSVSVLVELVASARRLRAPSIPLLGGFQRTASRLLATAGILLATTTSVTLPVTPAAAAGALVVPLDDVAPPPTLQQATTKAPTPDERPATVVSTTDSGTLPTVTVQRGDTLWDIAEHHLGDPLRYTEIRDLNHGRTQPDGRHLRDADWILPGWTLLLPADATDTDAPITTTSTTAADEATVVVQPGDTLWDIAATHLGDGARYPEIADLNHDMWQSDGGRLTDPDLIRPGWVLRLPGETTTAAEPASPAGTVATPQPSEPTTTPAAVAQPTTPPSAYPTDLASAAVTAEPAPSQAATDSEAEALVDLDDEADEARPTNTWFLGFAALGAVGVVGEIARRRHLQQRARQVGETIPLPDPGSPAAAAERTLRAAATPVSIDAIRTTLTDVGCRCFDAGRDLPRIGALLLDEHHLTLLLVDDAPDPVAPFSAPDPRTWVATTTDVAAEQIVDDPDQVNPYPLVVVLGHTDEATVILNLEAAGTLAIVGDDTAAEDALRALVMEAATSEPRVPARRPRRRTPRRPRRRLRGLPPARHRRPRRPDAYRGRHRRDAGRHRARRHSPAARRPRTVRPVAALHVRRTHPPRRTERAVERCRHDHAGTHRRRMDHRRHRRRFGAPRTARHRLPAATPVRRAHGATPLGADGRPATGVTAYAAGVRDDGRRRRQDPPGGAPADRAGGVRRTRGDDQRSWPHRDPRPSARQEAAQPLHGGTARLPRPARPGYRPRSRRSTLERPTSRPTDPRFPHLPHPATRHGGRPARRWTMAASADRRRSHHRLGPVPAARRRRTDPRWSGAHRRPHAGTCPRPRPPLPWDRGLQLHLVRLRHPANDQRHRRYRTRPGESAPRRRT